MLDLTKPHYKYKDFYEQVINIVGKKPESINEGTFNVCIDNYDTACMSNMLEKDTYYPNILNIYKAASDEIQEAFKEEEVKLAWILLYSPYLRANPENTLYINDVTYDNNQQAITLQYEGGWHLLSDFDYLDPNKIIWFRLYDKIDVPADIPEDDLIKTFIDLKQKELDSLRSYSPMLAYAATHKLNPEHSLKALTKNDGNTTYEYILSLMTTSQKERYGETPEGVEQFCKERLGRLYNI